MEWNRKEKNIWGKAPHMLPVAELQNTLQLICISLNNNSVYCVMPHSTKHFDTRK